MGKKTSDDFKNFSGHELNLLRTHMTTMRYQLRLKLLRSLLRQKLATRDIFFFVKGQADQRTYNKSPDWVTAELAMRAKLLDIKNGLKKSYLDRTRAGQEITEDYVNRKFTLKKNIK